MKKRIISAVILLAITAVCMFTSVVTRVLFFAAAGIVCAWELSKNFEKLDAHCCLWVMVTYLSVSAVMVLAGADIPELICCFIGAVYLSLFAGIVQKKVFGKGAFYTMGGICYPCMLFVLAMVISASDFFLEALALGCISSWCCDAFALFGGRRFGKHKLAPIVSPNKTIEGSICGAISSVIAGFAVWLAFHYGGESDIPLWLCLVTAFFASSMGQIGDLAESMLKRLMGVKDFSNLIPGHGGLFDRADALLFSIPTAYFLIRLAKMFSLY